MSNQVLSRSADAPPLAYGFRYLQGSDPLLESIHSLERAAVAITSRIQLTAWVQGPLRTLIPHEKALVGYGHVGYSTSLIDHVHAVDLDDSYFGTIHSAVQQRVSPVMAKWMQLRAPQIILPSNFCRVAHDRWHQNFKRHQLENGLFDASIETGSGRMSFIKLFNVGSSLEGGVNVLAQCVTPLLADIWKRIESHIHEERLLPHRRSSSSLTPAEHLVTSWLRKGKTNWEIGQILGKSEFTVKTQVQRMLKKTGLESRHALAASDH